MPPLAHSPLGASSAHCWSQCPGSVKAKRLFFARHRGIYTSSPHAEEGTRAHDLAEELLRHPERHEADYAHLEDQMMLGYTLAYRNYCIARIHGDGLVFIEQRVQMPRVHAQCFGTADFITYSPSRRHLDVIDLKYGQGVAVSAQNNLQLALYAEGARGALRLRADTTVDTISMHIFQPRALGGGGITQWDLTTPEHDAVVRELREAARRVGVMPDIYNPGTSQCRWCEAKPDCRVHVDWVREQLADVFGHYEEIMRQLKDNTISNDEVAQLLDELEPLKPLLYKLNDMARHRAMTGSPIPGKKLVAGSASYVADIPMIEFVLGDEAFKPAEPKSRTELKKRLGAAKFRALEGFYHKSEGQPVLVDASDRREAVASGASIDELFDDADT